MSYERVGRVGKIGEVGKVHEHLLFLPAQHPCPCFCSWHSNSSLGLPLHELGTHGLGEGDPTPELRGGRS